MNRSDLIKLVVEQTGIDFEHVRTIVDQFLLEIRQATDSGESVTLRNFGKFLVVSRSATKYRDIATKCLKDRPSRKYLIFKPSTKLNQIKT